MRVRVSRFVRTLLALALPVLIAACQTMPPVPATGLSGAQVAALRAQGFVETEQGWEFGMADRLLFATDESRLIPEQAEAIRRITRALLSVDIGAVRVEGHTDQTGAADYNQALSQRRAATVADAMVEATMRREDISVVGLGAAHPVETNRTAAGRRENRRVVIVVTAH